jgi:hypothetical protein
MARETTTSLRQSQRPERTAASLNETSRYNLVIDVLDRVPKLPD